MKILISNDDSIYSAGINILYQHFSEFADVKVVAPDRDTSGASNSLTVSNPIRTKELRKNFISVEGTPTDSVHLAINGLLDWRPDYVISGINHGANLGEDTLYSGTVAAAIEGMLLGIPSMAVSLASKDQKFLETAVIVTRKIVESLNSSEIEIKSVLNINVPNISYDDLNGTKITRLGSRHNAEKCIRDTDPRGRALLWIAPPGAEQEAGPGTDFHAIANNMVSITPIKTNMTDYINFDYTNELLSDVMSIKN